jgi:secretion/DNA translocation related CpaE-like protein
MAAPLLLLTDDEALVGAVGRLAAASGVDLTVTRDAPPSAWTSASAVLVGADAAAGTARSGPPRRDLVHVLSLGSAGDDLFRHALTLGASSVVELPDGERWLAGLLADLGDDARASGIVVAVVGGSGGAGASTLAAAIALSAAGAAGATGATDRADPPPVALIDLDPLGPGLTRLLGREAPGRRGDGRTTVTGSAGGPAASVTWSDLGSSHGRLGARDLRTSLAPQGGVGVLGWGGAASPRELPATAVLREVVSAARRGHRWVVLDVPRHAAADLAPVVGCEHWLVVARPAVAPVASAAAVVGLLRERGADVRLVVRGGDAETVARVLGAPLIATLGRHRRLDEHLDLGLGPLHGRGNSLRGATHQVLDSLEALAPEAAR